MQLKTTIIFQTELPQRVQNVKALKRIVLLFTICLMHCSCKAQNVYDFKLDTVDYDILRAFLEQVEAYTYVDKHFFNKNRIVDFIGRFKYHVKFQRNADSICNFSKDIDKRKFYCPLSNNFAYFDGLIDEGNLKYLLNNYDNSGEVQTMEIDSILFKKPLQKHSENYYQDIDYKNGFGRAETLEYPSVRIENLYYNEDRSVAIIAYSIYNNSRESINNYYIFKKTDGIWWKPLGSFKL
ncbi:hypothetical protein Q2T41_11225 [Maribacter confluentis]|uniref:Uncharacterized protein n=2 Tax=Maribacter confluentis TaxID=1656093 RepID=A0ABT8RQQ0_9FLAO|nr:hypothetical protein [Maribacter confluentis]MDO1513228.1 hypothetical protein [Maribacter confluentis]